MSVQKKHPLRIGLLGGGQLARLLILKGHQMGFEMHVLCETQDLPAAQVTSHVSLGQPTSPKDLKAFAKKVDLLTFESEFFPGAELEKAGRPVTEKMQPSLACLSLLQDRLSQKKLLVRYGLPTASFVELNKNTSLKSVVKTLGFPFIFKKRFGGYDGYGTFKIKNEEDLLEFEKQGSDVSNYIAEKFIFFEKEVAIQVGRQHRQISFLPLVQTQQVDHRLDWLQGPLSPQLLKPVLPSLKKMLQKINYHGVIAFEFFLSEGKLLVNEIAPRIHNSGHATTQACLVDQFELHLRAIAGLPLPAKTQLLAPAFAMTNLIGTGCKKIVLKTDLQTTLTWYGKKESRKGRKMGHITALGSTQSEALKKAIKTRKACQL